MNHLYSQCILVHKLLISYFKILYKLISSIRRYRSLALLMAKIVQRNSNSFTIFHPIIIIIFTKDENFFSTISSNACGSMLHGCVCQLCHS